jgi:hypothetical protein
LQYIIGKNHGGILSILHNKQMFEEIDKVLRDTKGHQMSKEQYNQIACLRTCLCI